MVKTALRWSGLALVAGALGLGAAACPGRELAGFGRSWLLGVAAGLG